MRLSNSERENIKASFLECFSPADSLWLFGSRVDDSKRGGDIDLYIELQHFHESTVFNARNRFWTLLQDRLGEQKIDIVVCCPNEQLLIYHVARTEGVKLV
jgi:hypothetical protein